MKSITYFFKIGFSAWLFSMLVGCELYTTTTNPTEYQDLLYKRRNFTQTYFICEVKDWHVRNQSGVYLIEEKSSCPPGMGFASPSLSEYQRNKAYWNNWHNSFFVGNYRILGIVGPGMAYHIHKIEAGYEFRSQHITIDSGPFSGMNAEILGFSELDKVK